MGILDILLDYATQNSSMTGRKEETNQKKRKKKTNQRTIEAPNLNPIAVVTPFVRRFEAVAK